MTFFLSVRGIAGLGDAACSGGQVRFGLFIPRVLQFLSRHERAESVKEQSPWSVRTCFEMQPTTPLVGRDSNLAALEPYKIFTVQFSSIQASFFCSGEQF